MIFVVACMIVGLYYMADMVEGHLVRTRKIITYATLGTLGILVLLWLIEKPSWTCMVPTIAAQLGYYRLLKQHKFPFVAVSDPGLVVPAALSVAAHVAWMRHHLQTYHNVAVVLGFFLVSASGHVPTVCPLRRSCLPMRMRCAHLACCPPHRACHAWSPDRHRTARTHGSNRGKARPLGAAHIACRGPRPLGGAPDRLAVGSLAALGSSQVAAQPLPPPPAVGTGQPSGS